MSKFDALILCSFVLISVSERQIAPELVREFTCMVDFQFYINFMSFFIYAWVIKDRVRETNNIIQ